MNENMINIVLTVAAALLVLLLLFSVIHAWVAGWGHRYRSQIASQHQWLYHKHPHRLFTKGVVFHLTGQPDERIPWELVAHQSGPNKIKLSWYSESRQFPEGLVVLYPRPGRIMKTVPRSLIPTMLNRVFGPSAVPLSDHVTEVPLGDEMLDELFFVFTAHRSLVPRLLTPTIRNLLVHWPAPKGYSQRPIVALFRRGLRLETVDPIPVNDWLATERFIGLGLTIRQYIDPFRSSTTEE
jgi:hypothetical protein